MKNYYVCFIAKGQHGNCTFEMDALTIENIRDLVDALEVKTGRSVVITNIIPLEEVGGC